MSDEMAYNNASDLNDPRNAPDCPTDANTDNPECMNCSGLDACQETAHEDKSCWDDCPGCERERLAIQLYGDEAEQ